MFLTNSPRKKIDPKLTTNWHQRGERGQAQRLVDNYRKGQQNDPVTLLEGLWKELERRFGSAAVITNALLEHMQKSAAFNESDNTKL